MKKKNSKKRNYFSITQQNIIVFVHVKSTKTFFMQLSIDELQQKNCLIKFDLFRYHQNFFIQKNVKKKHVV